MKLAKKKVVKEKVVRKVKKKEKEMCGKKSCGIKRRVNVNIAKCAKITRDLQNACRLSSMS